MVWPWKTAPWAMAISTWPAIAELLAKYNPAINLNIEIHSQFAPFRLDILRRGVLVAASVAAGRRPGLVPGKVLDKAAARSLARQSCPTASPRGIAKRKTCKLGGLGARRSARWLT